MKYLNFLHAVAEGVACGGTDVLRVLRFIFKLVDIAFFIIPMALILLVIIDFSKNVIAQKEDEMKKNVNIAIKRVVYCVVLFFVPTIVNAVISIVGDAGVEAVKIASKCIEIARDDNDDLTTYEVDYDTFEPTRSHSCYVCKNDSTIRIWSKDEPTNGTSGCSEFKIDSTRLTQEYCEEKNKYCWKCMDGSGFVWRTIQPGSGFIYRDYADISFNTSSSICGSGFYSKPVNDDFCKRCWKCLDGNGFVLSRDMPQSGFIYDSSNSFNITGSKCDSGFYNEPVNSCNCSNEENACS